jgi:hypothetical protein
MRNLIPRQSRSRRARLSLAVLFLIFFMIGAGISIVGGYYLIKSSKSSSWPSTDGVVKTAELKTQLGGKSTTYGADVSYDYFVGGKPFTGYRIRMVSVESSKKADAQQDLAKYPVGGKVKVFYSPGDPADSVLEPGIQPSSWFLPGVGGAFILISLIGMVTTRFRKRRYY